LAAPVAAPIAAGLAHLVPDGGAVDRAVKPLWVDKGLQQQQGVTEALRTVSGLAPFAQRQHPRGEVRHVMFGEDQKPTVVGDQIQTIVLAAKFPADPGVARGTRPGRGREAQQCQPLSLPDGDIPQRVPDLRQRPQIVMGRHQALEARLFGRGDGFQDDLAQVDARVLGWRRLRRFSPVLPGVVQSRGQPHGKTLDCGVSSR
jgi:hypothetical protein